MDAKLLPRQISQSDFGAALARYEQLVPDKLKTLDRQRLHAIPEAYNERYAKGQKLLTKDEVVTLVEWKL